MIDAFLNANKSKNKDLRESNNKRKDDKEVSDLTSSGIPLSQIFVSYICILKKAHHDVVGILIRNESRLSIYMKYIRTYI